MPLRGRARRLLVQAHLWLGGLVGLVFAVASLTGAALTFRHEIDAALNAGAGYVTTPGDVGFRVAERAARAARPGLALDLLWFPRWDRPYYEANLTDGRGGEAQLVIDPGTGRVLEPRGEPSAVMAVVETVHTSLLGGEVGTWVVGVSTLLAVVVLVTGAFLWWPGLRRLALGFRVRTRGAYAVNHDLHAVVGLLALPLLLVMCASGVLLAWPDAASRALHALLWREPSPVVDWTSVRSGAPPAGWTEADVPTLEALIARAHREIPGARTFYVTWPQAPDEPVHVRLRTGVDPKPFGLVSRLAFDRYTGALLQVVDGRRMSAPDRLVHGLAYRLHVGDFNAATKALWTVACLVGVGLVGTGVALWWLKRRGPRRRRAAAAGADRRRAAVPDQPVAVATRIASSGSVTPMRGSPSSPIGQR